MYYTSKDYYSDLKNRGLIPSNGQEPKKPEKKKYELSEWGRKMMGRIDDCKGKNGKLSDLGEKFHSELEKRGQSLRGRVVHKQDTSGLNKKEGGFSG